MNNYLETARIHLREFEPQDEGLLFDLDSDPEVMKYLTDGTPSTKEHISDVLKRTHVLNKKHEGRFGFWAAFEKCSGQFMGWFHFRPSKSDPENTKRIELGYRLKKAFWRKGFATEGSQALIAKGFNELDVEEAFAVTMKANSASRRVMVKSGLVFSHEYLNKEFPGTQKEAVEYSLFRQDWAHARSDDR